MPDTHDGSGNSWRSRIAGVECELPLLDGRLAPYINLDNAATTPPLCAVIEAIAPLPSLLFQRASWLRLQIARQHGRVRRSA